jgi:hypothetical protein
MPEIVLSAEQANVVSGAGREILVLAPDGGVVGCLVKSCFTPEEIENARKLIGSKGPWYTTAQVWEHIRAMEHP